jgi:hypothetical protein
MSDQMWEPGQIYWAWAQIHRALLEAMKPLPRQTLAFLASTPVCQAGDWPHRDGGAKWDSQ